MKPDIKRYLESFHIYSRPSFGESHKYVFFLELHD